DVGGVLEERENALLAIFGKGVKVEEPVVGRCWIDLEVAGMDNDAKRSVNGEGDAVHKTVRDLDWIDREGANGEAFARLDLDQFCVVEKSMFFELVLYVSERKLCAVDRDIELS